ncbi:MAG: DNA repair protein RadA [Spirochaetae bacterium HGW-Spirochaetae-9]|nr:MAG: DNA repair protein RadA [Spirochaetae bacterium HGW-Spirochaetae-9]
MKRQTTVHRCSNCGHAEPKWLGRCPECGQWNTLKEQNVAAGSARAELKGETYSLPIGAIDPASGTRLPSGSTELDRVLGGGFMRGSAILLGGEPGIGKSTLLLQVCAKLKSKGRVLYVSGEESPAQIRMRADRLGALKDNLEVFCASDLDRIMSVLEAVRPVLTVIDSIQTVYSPDAGAVPGTANQIKYCTMEMTEWAKTHDSIIVFVAHVTKDGLIAGPKAAEHIVDAVLAFEQAEGDLRALRASKNRYGSTDELGLYRMGSGGLVELSDPSGILLIRRTGELPPGVAVSIVHEGSRVLLVEIQALTVPAKAGITRVYSDRIDASRVARIAAVIEKQTGLKLSDQDIYINVAGGVRLSEPGIDLALAAALYSARTGQALPKEAALAGELSLAGEVRPVRQMAKRARAAKALGFSAVLGPAEVRRDDGDDGESKPAARAGVKPEWAQADSLKASIRALWR